MEYVSQKRDDYVCGVDSSHIAIKRARQRCRTVDRFVLGDFYDLDVPELLEGRRFESIVANAAFVHLLKREDIDAILRKIWGRLLDGGVLFIRCLYKELAGKPLKEEVDKWGPRWFVYYSPKELAEKCCQAGFEVDFEATERILSSCGRDPVIAREKGAKHAQFQDVYWSCLLARKRTIAQS